MSEIKKVENPKLKELLKKRADIDHMDDKEYQTYLNSVTFEIAERARFLCLLQMTAQDMENENAIKFVMFHDETNDQFLSAFTDEKEMKKAPDAKNVNAKAIVMSFGQYVEFIKDRNIGIVINPYGDNLKLNHDLVMQMKRQSDHFHNSLQKKVEEDAMVQLNNFQTMPKEAISVLSRLAFEDSRVKKMWLKAMIKDEHAIMLVIVDSSEDDKELYGSILLAGTRYCPQGMICQVASYHSDFGKTAADNEPFYVRNEDV